MFRSWKTTVRELGSHPSPRHPRRFNPSLTTSASCLEDRVVLSGAGGTHAGQIVINLYESILATNPTDAQLVKGVQEVRHGGVAALRKQLTNEARREHRVVTITTLGVSVSRLGSKAPLSTFSTTMTHAGTPTASSQARQFAPSVNQNFRSLSLSLTSGGARGPRTLTFTTTRRTTGTTRTGTTTTTTTGITQSPISQLPISMLPISPMPIGPI